MGYQNCINVMQFFVNKYQTHTKFSRTMAEKQKRFKDTASQVVKQEVVTNDKPPKDLSETQIMFAMIQNQHEQQLNGLCKSQRIASKQNKTAIKMIHKMMLQMAVQMEKNVSDSGSSTIKTYQ